jgi:hypothetical protein
MSAATLPLAGVDPVPPQRVPRRVWLDLEVPVELDVDELLAAALWFQLTIAPTEPAGLIRGFEGVGYYVEASCRVCGCSDTRGCETLTGCSWVEPDLCSECVDLNSLEDRDRRPLVTVRDTGGRL